MSNEILRQAMAGILGVNVADFGKALRDPEDCGDCNHEDGTKCHEHSNLPEDAGDR